jgi:exonuclease III
LFQLEPKISIFHAHGGEQNFAYLHTTRKSTLMQFGEEAVPRGLGFGGSRSKPRLFIPESLEGCTAGFLDNTFEEGRLVSNSLEKFEISAIEIWCVNGDEAIKKALRDQEEYRERHQAFLQSARVVQDKSQFVGDFETGLIPNSLYDHKRHARGRQDFRVDEEHGGYTVDRE